MAPTITVGDRFIVNKRQQGLVFATRPWDFFRLAHRLAFQRFAVGVENLHFVHAAFVAALVGPDDFLFWGYFQQLDVVFAGCAVAGDDSVAVGQALGAAGIVQERRGQVGVGQLPDDLSVLIHLDHHVAVGAIDEGVAVFQADG